MDLQKIMNTIDSIAGKIFAAVPYVFVVLLLVAVTCLTIGIVQTFQKCRSLRKKLKDGVLSDKNVLFKRLDKVLRRRAIYDFENRFEMPIDRKGHDRPEFVEYLGALKIKLQPLIFEPCEYKNGKTTLYVVNPGFLSWLNTCDVSYGLMDFEKAVWHYFKSIDQNEYNIIVNGSTNEEQEKHELQFKLEQEEEDAVRRELSYNIIKMKKEREAEGEKSAVLYRYKQCVQNIHDNGDHGLMPDRPQSIPVALYREIYEARVYGHQQIYRMINDVKWNNLSAKGCYIIYNTFNGKHLVGKADNLYADLKACLLGSSMISDFRRDLMKGHMLLVKFVPISNSGMSDINVLYEALCRAYKAFIPSGYNSTV